LAALRDRVALGLTCAASVASAAVVYLLFLSDSRQLWTLLEHDRNSHYLYGLRMGLDIRSGDLVRLCSDFFSLRSWPPLHAVFVALLTAVGGPHYQLAVLPSLAAWCGTAVLSFLIVRRIVPGGGNFGGIVAAFFVLASPAYRAFAVDVMLESGGAFFSLLVLYYYIVDKQAGTPASKPFALALCCLFFEKYNYWALVAFALVLSETTFIGLGRLVQLERVHVAAGMRREWLSKQVRRPLNFLVIGLGVTAAATHLFGGASFDHLGLPLRFSRSSQNLWHFTFLAVVLRIAAHWRTEGRFIWRKLSVPTRRLILWHVLPIVVWFSLPKRLGYFVYYMTAEHGANGDGRAFSGLRFYVQRFADEYHAFSWAAATAAVLLGIGLLSRKKAEWRAVGMVLLAGLALAASHPSQKSRFLHSWLPTTWILAGAGLAALSSGRRIGTLQKVAPISAAVALVCFAAAHSQTYLAAGRAAESHRRDQPTTLDLADVYLPWISDSKQVAVFTTMPGDHFAEWSYLEADPSRPRPEVSLSKWFGPSPEANKARFDAWLAATRVERIVLVDVPPGSGFYSPAYETYGQIRALMATQDVFAKTKTQAIVGDSAVATLWERAPLRR
jgi:hypothetical protein